MGLAFTVENEIWLAGEKYESGDHEIEKPSADLVKHAGSAHAAGELTVTDGLDDSHVQSQEDAEAALAAAMGEWVDAVQVDAVFAVDEEGARLIDDDGEPVVLEAAYLIPGYWTGPWHEGNVGQYELEQTQKHEREAAA